LTVPDRVVVIYYAYLHKELYYSAIVKIIYTFILSYSHSDKFLLWYFFRCVHSRVSRQGSAAELNMYYVLIINFHLLNASPVGEFISIILACFSDRSNESEK
jgi:hypothetical protein